MKDEKTIVSPEKETKPSDTAENSGNSQVGTSDKMEQSANQVTEQPTGNKGTRGEKLNSGSVSNDITPQKADKTSTVSKEDKKSFTEKMRTVYMLFMICGMKMQNMMKTV